jgi:hypothetical protein
MGSEATAVVSDAQMLPITLEDELLAISPLCYFVPNLPTSVLLGKEGIVTHCKRVFQQDSNILALRPQPYPFSGFFSYREHETIGGGGKRPSWTCYSWRIIPRMSISYSTSWGM